MKSIFMSFYKRFTSSVLCTALQLCFDTMFLIYFLSSRQGFALLIRGIRDSEVFSDFVCSEIFTYPLLHPLPIGELTF